jgi:hypothetical protein
MLRNMTPKEIRRAIRGVFKLPVKQYYFGKLQYGCPYFYPWNFNQTILTIRKNRPQFLRCKYFKLFGYEISYGWPIAIANNELGWKWKYDDVRFEWCPSFQILLFGLQFCIHWTAPNGDDDQYYEQILHYIKKSDKDIIKAKETWGWVNHETKQSTWNDKYLINNIKDKS